MKNTVGPCTVALHVPDAPAGNVEALHWAVSHQQPIRAEAWTCPAHPVTYEVGWVGGVYRIRRTTRTHRLVEVHDSPAVLRFQTEEWWRLLLAGQAL